MHPNLAKQTMFLLIVDITDGPCIPHTHGTRSFPHKQVIVAQYPQHAKKKNMGLAPGSAVFFMVWNDKHNFAFDFVELTKR